MVERVIQDRIFSISRLARQTNQASELLGAAIVPSSLGSDAFLTPVEELKREYPQRYGIYLQTIRAIHNNRPIVEGQKEQNARLLHTLNSIDMYIRGYKEGDTERTLTGRQFTVFEDLQRFLEQGETAGYIKLPTGTGKTVLYAEFVEASGLKTLIIVPKQLLIHQTERRFEQFAENVQIGKVYAYEKDFGKQVTITTYDSFVSGVQNGRINPDEYGLLILDEAHRSLSRKRRAVVDKFDKAIRLGFTATPNYSHDKRVAHLLNTEIHAMTIREAVEGGMLSSFRSIFAETDVDLTDVSITSSGDYDAKELERAINIEKRNRAAVDLYKEMFIGQTTVAYCQGIQHASDLADFFTNQGISAAVISGEQTRNEQQNILKKYHAGEIKVLCNADILIEGFDEPTATVCLNLRPTLSPVIAEQRGGRVLRLDPDNPVKFAYIVDFLDKTNNKKAYPITFAQVAQAAYLLNRKTSEAVYTGRPTSIKSNIHIDGLRVVTNVEEVMEIVQNMILQKYTSAPAGWMNRFSLSRELERSAITVKRYTAKYRLAHPEWFRQYLDSMSRVVEYLAPELVTIITQEIGSGTKAPDGWMNNAQLAKSIEKATQTVKRLAERQRKDHPEWFRKYIDGMGQTRDHYAPELVAYIKEEISGYKPAPLGWVNNHALAADVSRGDRYVRAIAEQYQSEYPGWFQVYLDSSQNPAMHYAPELIVLIRDELSQYEQSPFGWNTRWETAKQLGRDTSTITRVAMKYRDTNSDWFHNYTTISGRIVEHYSPQLIQAISDELSQYTYAPDGWANKNTFARVFQKYPSVIERLTNKFRQAHPDWFQAYLTPSGNLAEHFHPKLVIMTILEIKSYLPAPESWMNASQATKILWKGSQHNREKFNQYRQEYPEWFGVYLDAGGRVVEYYAPELIELFKEQKEQLKPAPEGWMTRRQVARAMSIHTRVVGRYSKLYKEQHPEWFGNYVNPKGSVFEYLSPEFIDAVQNAVSSYNF